MFPSLAKNNSGYRCTANGKMFGYFSWCQTVGLQLANFLYLFCRQFGWSHAKSALVDHVVRIFLWCTRKEMGGITTRRIVARVADECAIGDGAMRQSVCRSVSVGILKSSIAAWVFSSRPRPALVRAMLINLFPETFREQTASAMTMTELNRVSLNPFASGIGLAGNLGALTASTVAVSVGDFLSIHTPILPRLQEAGACQLSKVGGF